MGKKHHIKVIKTIAEGMRSIGMLNNYLEIGIAGGLCFNQVAPLAKRAWAVDIREKSYDRIKHNKNLHWFNYESDKFFVWSKERDRFDMIFIDGSHEYKQGVKDFENSLKHLNVGGIICIHDTCPPDDNFKDQEFCGDIYKIKDYIKSKYSGEFLTFPFYYGITIYRKTVGA